MTSSENDHARARVRKAVDENRIGVDGREHRFVVERHSSYGVMVRCHTCKADVGTAEFIPDGTDAIVQLIVEHAWPPIRWTAPSWDDLDLHRRAAREFLDHTVDPVLEADLAFLVGPGPNQL